MTREEWQRIKRIAGEAWDQPADARLAFIADACDGDEELGVQVRSLLASTAAASQLFETPALNTPGAIDAIDAAAHSRSAIVGTLVGSYRIVRELGHGGMGSVYLAERADGEFEQQVAIKIVAGGISTDVLARRFREERRILATLEHPNIARLFDGGTSTDGLPYVVMEYVAGVPITEFCEANGLSIRARIELIQKLCAAVQYAHQRLVIHRDIKASNILVTSDGMLKLLDFGIATLAEPGLVPGARTVLRAHTPETVSPEQLRGDPITVAVDIYALGLLAFELLAGESPYAGKLASEAELVRAICEEDPRPPSAVAAASRGRDSDSIDRDLDLIILKAIRKEPDRRYHSVEQLSEDLRRYLEGRPVIAAPDSRRYRTAKFIGRHRAAVAVTTVALLATLGGAGVATYQAGVARRERARAEERLGQVRRLTDSFLFEFHDAIADLPGSLRARQLVVKRAAEFLDVLAGEAQNDVTLQRELATAHERLATILGGAGVSSLGDLEGAKAQYARALEIREALAARPKAAEEDVAALADLRVQLARQFAAAGDLTRAADQARQAVTLLQASMGSGLPSGNHLGRLATAYHQLGYVQARRAENDAALQSFERAVTSARRQIAVAPDDLNELARLSRIQIDYANQLSLGGKPQDALDTLREVETSIRRLLENDSLNVRHRLSLVEVFNAEGGAFDDLGDHTSSVDAFSKAVMTAEALKTAGPEDHGNAVAAMLSHHFLGVALVRSGQTAAGERRLREAIGEGESITKARPDDGWSLNQLATEKFDLGTTLFGDRTRTAEGCRAIGEGLQLWNQLAARVEIPAESTRHRDQYERLWADCRRRGL